MVPGFNSLCTIFFKINFFFIPWVSFFIILEYLCHIVHSGTDCPLIQGIKCLARKPILLHGSGKASKDIYPLEMGERLKERVPYHFHPFEEFPTASTIAIFSYVVLHCTKSLRTASAVRHIVMSLYFPALERFWSFLASVWGHQNGATGWVPRRQGDPIRI